MFLLGLEMEPLSILNRPVPETIIAYASIMSTVVLSFGSYFLLRGLHGFGGDSFHEHRILIIFTLMFAATSSPTTTGLINELNLGKSDIGRRAIRSAIANDMACTFLIALFFILDKYEGGGTTSLGKIFTVVVCLAAEMVVVVMFVRPFFSWVNDNNPEEAPMNELHSVATAVVAHVLCYMSYLFGYDTKVNAFLVGLALPREGRVSNFLISNMSYALSTFMLPLYFPMINLEMSKKTWEDSHNGFRRNGGESTSWFNLIFICWIAAFGKMAGTIATSWYFGLRRLEAVALCVILNVKGYLHVFFTYNTSKEHFVGDNALMIVMIMVMLSITFAPMIVSFIVSHIRTQIRKPQKIGLQWISPATEMRIMVCFHGPNNVSAAANIVEMLRGGSLTSATTTGLVVTAMDLIEVTEHAATSLVYTQGGEAVTITDENVVQLREQIRAAVNAHMEAGEGTGLKVNQDFVISPFGEMHMDICNSAQENLNVLIVLPFHKTQRDDGGFTAGHAGFRKVNQNVLQRAGCSVGILVDRGLGTKANALLPDASLNVAVVFTGGADDREALAYAGCIAKHPSVRLMVIRFLPDKEAIALAAGPGQRILTSVTDEEKDNKMKEDDDYFAGFYEQYIAPRGVGYMEKHVINGAEAVAALKVVEAGYQLFVVGKGREEDSVLMAGMSERAECPELGPMGDILASADFSVTASVLVIQQHDFKKDDLLSEEFL